MARVHSSQYRETCPDDAYESLYAALNQRSEKVHVKAKALDAVTECHARHGAKPPPALVYKNARGKIEVDRTILHNFLNDHGEICGKPPVGEGWQSSRERREARVRARTLHEETEKLQRQNKKANK